jgi:hypothetical protein
MIPFFPCSGRYRKGAGMALVITLGAVVLITALIVTFFSNAQLNRRISYSNTNTVKADQLTRSALEIVVGEIQAEIADPALSGSSNGGNAAYPIFYSPLVSGNALPRKVGTSGSSPWLLKVSGSDSAIDPGTNGRKMGTAVAINTPSRNGRYCSADRWFGSGSPALGTGTNDTLPTWVYITRSGVKTPGSLADAANPQTADYVIGRFAYTVYNQGGLMDANVAGYTASGSSAVPFKSSLAFADTSILGITGLAAWRNASTGANGNTFTQWAAGLTGTSAANPGAMASAASGHTSAVAGDNAFFSRHDLLLAARNAVAGLSGTQAESLTHFSRTLNAPSWIPQTITTANPDLGGVRFKNPTTITHYDDTGTSTTYSVLPGDPLIQRRFSLAKVRWITPSGPATGISGTAIQAAFGLAWSTTASRWEYVGGTGSTIQSSIETLDLVSAENREPNFFELLKAGIVEGSLGKASANQTLAQSDQMTLEGNKDFQTFQIGVNIIDCAGADNYPTRLGYGTAASPFIVYGVKDLPYLYGVVMTHFSSRTLVTPTQERLDYSYLVLVPELFNPHASGITSTGASEIRVRIANGTVNTAYSSVSGKTGPLSRENLALNLADPTGGKAIVVPSSSFEAFRTAMKPVQNTEAISDTTFNTIINRNLAGGAAVVSSADTPPSSQAHGFLYYQYTGLPSALYSSTNYDIRSEFNNLFVVLEYKDASSNWRIYDTWSGNEALSTQTGMGKTNPGADFAPNGSVTAASSPLVRNTLNSGGAAWKIDPRTTRFVGSGPNSGPSPLSTPVGPIPPPWVSGNWGGLNNATPFSPAPGGNSFYPGNWLTWKTGGSTKTGWGGTTYADNVADADTQLRPPDGWLGGSANFFSNMSNTVAATGRPVILHRPYRSVAELGCVFRATPWKTLSFFDDSSADGALLDLFAVSDEPTVVAGRIDLNSAQSAMQQALLNGVGQSYDGTSSLPSVDQIATAYQNYAYSSGSATVTLPTNVAQLPSFMTSTALGGAYPTSTNPIKYYRESVVRGLTAGTQTRTWNLLIDVVGQVGRFQTGSTPLSLANFIVEGEKRYWLSIAVDRYTGKVIDEQLEPADE